MAAEIFELEITPGRFFLKTPFAFKVVCQSVMGAKWDPSSKRWHWPNDSIAASELLDAFGPKIARIPGSEQLREIAGRGHSKYITPNYDPSEQFSEIPGLKPVVLPDGSESESWNHQKAGYHFAMSRPGALLPFYMGYGKSRVAVGLVFNRARLSLILCPKSVVPVWPREFEKHLLNPKAVYVVPLAKSGTAAKVKMAMDAFALLQREAIDKLALVVNYESAWRDPLKAWLMSAGIDTLVLDEGHKIKSAGGKASLFCKFLGERCSFRVALSGTPIHHSPLDIYGLYRTLDPRIFGTVADRFKKRYAIVQTVDIPVEKEGDKEKSYDKVVGYKNQEELRDKIKSIALFVPDNLLDLPPVQDITLPIILSAQARKILASLMKDFYAALKTGEITAGNALVRLLRMQQVTSGCVKLDDGSIQLVDAGKRHALEDLLEGMGDEPVVVFTRFTSDLDAVMAVSAALGLQYRELSGRANSLAEWQSGDGQVLGVNIQAGGAGIDLTRARYCVYYSLGFSLGDYMQSRARVHRPGQDRPVTYYHLVAENTVDSKVYAALAARQEVVDYIIKGVDFCSRLVENE